MPKRVQSPSSINTYKQCPRKYFYQYVLKYPTKQNIHCVRGNIVHEALEKFFALDTKILSDECKKDTSNYLKNIFDACWIGSAKRLQKVGLQQEKLDFYYQESVGMLANWLNQFFADVDKEMAKGLDFKQAFDKLKPIQIEQQYKDAELMVRGYIDAIHKDDGIVTLMDYKTSKSSDLKPEYLLQMGIYAVLYEKEHGDYPHKVGLWFLKDTSKIVDVTPDLVKNAEFEIEQIHASTESDRIGDYQRKKSGLCKWRTGQCDFHDVCNREGR